MIEGAFKPQEAGRVGVLMGGDSPERDISLRSGTAVLEALRCRSYDAVECDTREDVGGFLQREKIQRVFLALHGPGGEDGTIQGFLQCLGVAYTGSGVLASALAMHKILAKRVWQSMDIPTPPFVLLEDSVDLDALVERFTTVAVKPAGQGSSLGVTRVSDAPALKHAWREAQRQYGPVVFAERWIGGDEFTVPVLEEEVLPPLRIEAAAEYYDTHAKYQAQDTRYHCPCGLSAEAERHLRQLARRAYDALGCCGWGRVDLLQDQEGEFSVLEVNTVPGLTRTSLVPKSAQAAGLDFETLVECILHTSRRHEARGSEK